MRLGRGGGIVVHHQITFNKLPKAAGVTDRTTLRQYSTVFQRPEVIPVRPVQYWVLVAASLAVALHAAAQNARRLGARRRQLRLSRLFLENDLDVTAAQDTGLDSEEKADCKEPIQCLRTPLYW